MTMYELKPTPKLLTPEGWVLHGYMDQATLDAVLAYIEKERQAVQEAADVRFDRAHLTLLKAKWDKGGYICRSCGWSPAWFEVQQDVVEALDEEEISLPCYSENDDRSDHRGIYLDNPMAEARKIYYAPGWEEGEK